MKRSIISITDGNPINQNALKTMLKSLFLHSSNFDSVFALYPANGISPELSDWLGKNDVRTYSDRLDTEDDPYRVKFLLARFLKQQRNLVGEILYLDPDHIMLKEIVLESFDKSLQVSSEVRALDSRLVPQSTSGQQAGRVVLRHYNTSLIFGNLKTWHEVLDKWIEEYHEIRGFTPVRFREEIAFSRASYMQGVKLTPVGTDLQSSFNSFDPDCRMFHYGGAFPEATRIKRCLKSEISMWACLEETLERSENAVESWVVKEILEILDY